MRNQLAEIARDDYVVGEFRLKDPDAMIFKKYVVIAGYKKGVKPSGGSMHPSNSSSNP